MGKITVRSSFAQGHE